MKLLIDASHLGFQNLKPEHQSGVWRVTRGMIAALERHPAVDLHLGAHSSFMGELQLSAYLLQHNPELLPRLVNLWKNPITVPEADARVKAIVDALEAGDAALARERQLELNHLTLRAVPEPFDLMHSLFLGLPDENHVKARARILTAHDLIPVLFPEWCNDDPQVFRAGRLADFDPRRDFALAPSQCAKEDLCRVTGAIPERVFVVPWGLDLEIFQPPEDPEALDIELGRYGLDRDGYLLSVCTFEPRKNLPALLTVFYRLCREGRLRDQKLVLVGAEGWKYQGIFEALRSDPAMSERVVCTGYVADEALPALYAGAAAFVFPSFYEGFGMPPLEAMACGAPVISSNASSLPEVVGDAGLLVDPRDEDALGDAILQLLRDGALRGELRKRGLERSAAYRWDASAEGYVKMYQAILEAS